MQRHTQEALWVEDGSRNAPGPFKNREDSDSVDTSILGGHWYKNRIS